MISFCLSISARNYIPAYGRIRVDGHHNYHYQHHHHHHNHHPVYLLLRAQDEPLPPRAININNCTGSEIRAYIMYYTNRWGGGGAGSRGPVIRLPVMAVPWPHGELHSNYSRLRAALLLLSAGRYAPPGDCAQRYFHTRPSFVYVTGEIKLLLLFIFIARHPTFLRPPF